MPLASSTKVSLSPWFRRVTVRVTGLNFRIGVCTGRRMDSEDAKPPFVTRRELLLIVQAELPKHDFDCFVDASVPGLEPGQKGLVVPGCPYCKKKIYTMA